MKYAFICLSLTVAAAAASADSIEIQGVLHENVYVAMDDPFICVYFPDSGESQVLKKDDIDSKSIKLDDDVARRNARLKAWRARRHGAMNREQPSENALQGSSNDGEYQAHDSKSPQAFKFRKRLEALMKFEAELERWRATPEEVRSAAIGDLLVRLVDSQGKEALAALASRLAQAETDLRVSAIEQQAASHVEAIGASAASQAEATADVLNNPRLAFYREMLESTLIRRRVQDMTGNHKPYTNVTAQEYAAHVSVEEAKAARQAAEVARTHEAYRQEQAHRLQALNQEAASVLEANRAAQQAAHHAAVFASTQALNHAMQLERLLLLEGARTQDYKPSMLLRRIRVWNGRVSDTTDAFDISAPVWRLVLKTEGAGRVRVTLMDGKTNTPLTMIPWSQAPAWEILVMDTPGVFSARIDAQGEVDYELVCHEALLPS